MQNFIIDEKHVIFSEKSHKEQFSGILWRGLRHSLWKRKLPKNKLGVNIKVLLLLYLKKMIIIVTFSRFQEWNASCWPSPPASRPSISRQLSAPSTTWGLKLIEALGMPHRRAFNLGISATTIVSLANKREGAAAARKDLPHFKQAQQAYQVQFLLQDWQTKV